MQPDRKSNMEIIEPTNDSTVGSQFTAYGTCAAVTSPTAHPTMTATLVVNGIAYPGTMSYGAQSWEALFTNIPSGTDGVLVLNCSVMPPQVVTGLTTGDTAVAVYEPINGEVYSEWGDHKADYVADSGYKITNIFITEAGTPLPKPIGSNPLDGDRFWEEKRLASLTSEAPEGHDFVVHMTVQPVNDDKKKMYCSSGFFRVKKSGAVGAA